MKKSIVSLVLLCSTIGSTVTVHAGWFTDDRTAAQKIIHAITRRTRKEGKKFVKHFPGYVRKNIYNIAAYNLASHIVDKVVLYCITVPYNKIVSFLDTNQTNSNDTISKEDVMKLLAYAKMLEHENNELKKMLNSKAKQEEKK